MTKKRYKGIIFDMDGVLWDSEYTYLKSLQKCLYSLIHKNISIEELSNVIGMNASDITNLLLEKYQPNVDFDELTRLQSVYFHKELDEDGIQEMDGLTDFLERLKSNGYKLSIASSSDMPWILEVIETLRIEKYFDFSVSGDDIEHSKPNPEVFNIAANRMELDKSEIVVIEDSVNGITAANRANLDVIAYKGSSVKQDTHEATYEVSSFKEIENMLELY